MLIFLFILSILVDVFAPGREPTEEVKPEDTERALLDHAIVMRTTPSGEF